MKLLLKNAAGESVCVSILESDTFSDLKRRLSEEENIDIDVQDLSIEGKPIENHLNVIQYFNSNLNSDDNELKESWSCCMYGCSNSSQNTPNKQVYRFSKDEQRCAQWLKTLNPTCSNKNETGELILCEDHVTDGHTNNEEICRLCANKSALLSDIFQVMDDIKTCLPIRIESDDSLSKLICEICSKKLKTFKEFIDSCLSAEKKQLQLLEKNKEKENLPLNFNLDELIRTFEKFNEKNEILLKNNNDDDDYEIYCSICGKNAELVAYLQGNCHDMKVFSCFSCSFICDAHENFINHLKNHLCTGEKRITQKDGEAPRRKKSLSFKCDKCPKSFRCKNRLEFHVQFHLKGSNAGQCLECNKEFPTELCLYKHMLYNHLNRKIFTCEHCGKNFRNKSSLTYHLRSHKSFEAMRPFKCELCERRFARKNILRDHMTNRHGENNSKTCYQCRECKEIFPNTTPAVSHMEIHHPDFFDERTGYSFDMLTLNKLYICEFCDKCFSSSDYLIEHRIQHSPPTRYQCKTCNEEFVTHSDLKTHQDGHSSDGISDYKTDFKISILYLCEFCEKCLKNYQSYSNHVSTHKKENPYECKFCSENFPSHDLALLHKKTHKTFENPLMPKPFECQYCDKGFTSGSALTKHVRIHTGEKPFSCRVCNKSFRQSSGLYTHLKVHSNDRPYQCDLCDRAFKIVGDYKQHVRRHSGVRPYSCDVCSKTFITQRSFTQHKKIHSDGKSFVCDVCNESFRRSHTLKIHKLKHRKNDENL